MICILPSCVITIRRFWRMSSRDDDLRASLEPLAKMIAKIIVEHMQPSSGGPAAITYSSGQLPPDCPSKARFNQLCRKIDGATKRGRTWFVSADTWHAHRNQKKLSTTQRAETIEQVDWVSLSVNQKFRRLT